MKTVFKYPIKCEVGVQVVDLPLLWEKVVHFGEDPSGNVCMWVEVPDRDVELVPCTFWVAFTGGDIPDEYGHVATCVLSREPIVLHLFEHL